MITSNLPANLKWKKTKALIELLEEGGFATYVVGGAVRDHLLHKAPSDFDIATAATPDEVASVLNKKAEVIPTGLQHGTVTAVFKRTAYEITTFRRDDETNGRHATVAFSKSMNEDAARRDFTINALYMNKKTEVYDPVNGQEDISKKVLRFVGDPEKRVKEDYLRILRMYRFWSQLDFHPTIESRKACQDNATHIKNLSRERVSSELQKTFARSSSSNALTAMVEDQIFTNCIPNQKVENKAWLSKVLPLTQFPETHFKCLFFIASFYLNADDFSASKDHWRLSKNQESMVKCILEIKFDIAHSQSSLMELIDEIERAFGPNSFLNELASFLAIYFHDSKTALTTIGKAKEVEVQKRILRQSKMPVNGHHIKDRFGFLKGEELGRVLEQLKLAYRDEKWKTRDEGFQFLEKMLTT